MQTFTGPYKDTLDKFIRLTSLVDRYREFSTNWGRPIESHERLEEIISILLKIKPELSTACLEAKDTHDRLPIIPRAERRPLLDGDIDAPSYAQAVLRIAEQVKLALCSFDDELDTATWLRRYLPEITEVDRLLVSKSNCDRIREELPFEFRAACLEARKPSVEHSPWIDSPDMIRLMKRNKIASVNDKQIQRKKKAWGAEPQPGTNNQTFRFRLSILKDLGIVPLPEWPTELPDTSGQ